MLLLWPIIRIFYITMCWKYAVVKSWPLSRNIEQQFARGSPHFTSTAYFVLCVAPPVFYYSNDEYIYVWDVGIYFRYFFVQIYIINSAYFNYVQCTLNSVQNILQKLIGKVICSETSESLRPISGVPTHKHQLDTKCTHTHWRLRHPRLDKRFQIRVCLCNPGRRRCDGVAATTIAKPIAYTVVVVFAVARLHRKLRAECERVRACRDINELQFMTLAYRRLAIYKCIYVHTLEHSRIILSIPNNGTHM